MKKSLFFAAMIVSCLAFSQKKKNDILKSKNVSEIEAYLKKAHPDDPRRNLLKAKLVAIKNANKLKNSSPDATIMVKPVVLEIPKSVIKQKDNDETEEFKKLVFQNSTAHKEKTVKLLNQLFSEDPTNKQTILLVQNNSDCNMIVRISGKDFYNLAVPARGENSIVVNKGSYQLTSNMCDAKYAASKNIMKNMLVILNRNPAVNVMRFANTTPINNNGSRIGGNMND